MAQKPLIFLSFSIAAIASAFILDGHSAPNARAQKTGAEAISPSIGQKSYPTLESDDWLSPRTFSNKSVFNTPVLIYAEGGKQRLALLSRDLLSFPQPQCSLSNLKDCGISANNPGREVRLVTQWSQSELRAWAYESLEVDNTRPKPPEPPNSGSPILNKPLWSPDKATIITYTPSPEVNEGLHRNLSWEAHCSIVCLFKPLKPLEANLKPPEYKVSPPVICPPAPPEVVLTETLPDGTVRRERIETSTKKDPSCVDIGSSGTESKPPALKPPVTSPQAASPARDVYRLTDYVGSQEFQLESKDGGFPIKPSLAKALREAKSSTVKIITPRKWEAPINPEAVKNLSVIYQESGSSQIRR
ncbi:MAG: hypothetical protein HC878_19645 [Leptolyngbyaceae cyanobacterium SL_5_14]|nr:hypothetical protein [Leptolyngbyaceae cyanobacterium SL_5_14]